MIKSDKELPAIFSLPVREKKQVTLSALEFADMLLGDDVVKLTIETRDTVYHYQR